MAFVEAAKTGDIQPGGKKAVKIDDREILVARVGDDYFAVDGRCPHLHGHLGQGRLEGTVITCPLHGSQFDVTDGRVLRWTTFSGFTAKVARIFRPPRGLRTYAVKAEDGRIMVDVEPK